MLKKQLLSHFQRQGPQVSIDSFYQDFYGPRWDSLKSALLAKKSKYWRATFPELLAPHELRKREIWNPEFCYFYCDDPKVDWSQLRDQSGRKIYLAMNPAAMIVSRALAVRPGDQVLDLCAAPGRKSLVLLEDLRGEGLLIANEPSHFQFNRLSHTTHDYVPKNLHSLLQLTRKSGPQIAMMFRQKFDRILVDAPCSKERRYLKSESEKEQWSPLVTKRFARNQLGLLCSAIGALKVNGRLVYSTSSISNLENDDVIQNLLSRKGEEVAVDQTFLPSFTGLEKTQFGYQLLPDRVDYGPIYFSRLIKKTKK